MRHNFLYICADIRKTSLQPGVSEHCKTTDTGWCITQCACLLPQLLPGTHSGLPQTVGLKLSRPECLVLCRGGLPINRQSSIQVLTRPSVE